jgi:PTH1 family peptidyl-tRNA hydrolase
MKLIVGLGNPGKEYMFTRHNVGFLTLDRILSMTEEEQFTPDRKNHAEICKTALYDKRVVLAKPQTFMNNSGDAVQALLSYYKLTPKDLIVIHDDKDIPLGTIRIQSARGAAGHNGVKSIIDRIGTNDFTRFRIGVAPKETPIADTADFVLGKFTKEEQQHLSEIFNHAIDNLRQLL